MIGRLNHVAIAVRDIAKASAVYRDTLGADVSAKVAQPDHGDDRVLVLAENILERLRTCDDLLRAGKLVHVARALAAMAFRRRRSRSRRRSRARVVS